MFLRGSDDVTACEDPIYLQIAKIALPSYWAF